MGAAERETFEETGYRVKLLPLSFKTLATQLTTAVTSRDGLLIDPFACTQRETKGVLKIILWFIAKGDSTATRQENTQQEDEDFESIWVPATKVCDLLSFDDDKQVARQAVEILQAQGA